MRKSIRRKSNPEITLMRKSGKNVQKRKLLIPDRKDMKTLSQESKPLVQELKKQRKSAALKRKKAAALLSSAKKQIRSVQGDLKAFGASKKSFKKDQLKQLKQMQKEGFVLSKKDKDSLVALNKGAGVSKKKYKKKASKKAAKKVKKVVAAAKKVVAPKKKKASKKKVRKSKKVKTAIKKSAPKKLKASPKKRKAKVSKKARKARKSKSRKKAVVAVAPVVAPKPKRKKARKASKKARKASKKVARKARKARKAAPKKAAAPKKRKSKVRKSRKAAAPKKATGLKRKARKAKKSLKNKKTIIVAKGQKIKAGKSVFQRLNPFGGNMLKKVEKVIGHDVMEAGGLLAGGAAIQGINHALAKWAPSLKNTINSLPVLGPVVAKNLDAILPLAIGIGAHHFIKNDKVKAVAKGVIGASVVNIGASLYVAAAKMSGATLQGIVAVPNMGAINYQQRDYGMGRIVDSSMSGEAKALGVESTDFGGMGYVEKADFNSTVMSGYDVEGDSMN